MKTLFIDHKPVWGGGQISLLNLASAFQKSGAEVRIICPPQAPVVAQARQHGIRTHELDLGQIRKSGNPLILLQNLLWRVVPTLALHKLIKTHPVDLVICNGTYSFIAALPLLRLSGLPHLWIVRNTSLPSGRVLAFLIRSCQAIVAVSRAVRDQFFALVPDAADRIFYIQNGVRFGQAVSPAAAGRHAGAQKTLLYLGRLSHEKGADILIEAARRLLQDRQDFTIIIAGDGPARQDLETQVQEAGLAASVKFEGHVADIGPVFARADLLVLPSRTEANPLALLEALCAGVPAVAADVGEVKYLAEQYAVRVVPADDPQAFAAGIDTALANLAALQSRARRQMHDARAAFSVEKMGQAYLELARRLIRHSRTESRARPVP